MANELMKYEESNELYSKIVSLIKSRKTTISQALNSAMIFLYWEIGETICLDVLDCTKADYGKSIVDEVSRKLTQEYGKGFNRAAVFRMIQFYQEFPDREKVATLSQQLTWSHFVELLPIEDNLKSSLRILVFSNMSQPAGSSACFFILCSQGIFHMSVQGVQSPLPFSYSAGLRGRSYTGTAGIDSCA
jgi:hypothetical protein